MRSCWAGSLATAGYPGKFVRRCYPYVEAIDLRADDEWREGETHLRHVVPSLTSEAHKP